MIELRDATREDLDGCLRLSASVELYDPRQFEAVKAMWTEIFTEKTGLGFVAAEPRRGDRIVHFGFEVFVSDLRAQTYRECREPLIARRIVAEWAAGERPFLGASEIARLNAGAGVNILGLHYGSIAGDDEFEHRLRAASLESMRRMHAGWNLRSITVEALDQPERPGDGELFAEALGFRCGRYTLEQLRAAGIRGNRVPCVWSATREESLRKRGYAMAMLFGQYTPPRCGFSANEQRILLLALDGKTDEAIAGALDASVPTVKKRFRIIYEKFGLGGECARGAETRRHLLNYVREHPEELRPYASEKRPAVTRIRRAS